MGSRGPKRPVDQVLEELEDEVSDAILTGYTEDKVLKILIDVTTASVQSGRPIYENPLHEPIFYRWFKGWVAGGLEEAAALEKAMEGKPKEQ